MANYEIEKFSDLELIEAKAGDVAILGGSNYAALNSYLPFDYSPRKITSRQKSYYPPKIGKGGKVKRWQ